MTDRKIITKDGSIYSSGEILETADLTDGQKAALKIYGDGYHFEKVSDGKILFVEKTKCLTAIWNSK